MFDPKLYIDGEFCDAAGGDRFASVEPATEERWIDVPEAREADVDRAVAAAKRACDRALGGDDRNGARSSVAASR